jgi:hypothetical protein
MTTKKKSDSTDDYALMPTPTSESIMPLLNNESDRGVILIGAAYLEEILGSIINGMCVNNTYAKEILSLKGPAGDYESKLLITQAFGIIHPEHVKSLRIIQRMRNKAAHFERGGRGFNVLFNTSETIAQVTELAQGIHLEVPKGKPTEAEVRNLFIHAMMYLASTLAARRAQYARPAAALSESERIENVINACKGTQLEFLTNEIKNLKKEPYLYNNLIITLEAAISVGRKIGRSDEEIITHFIEGVLNKVTFDSGDTTQP